MPNRLARSLLIAGLITAALGVAFAAGVGITWLLLRDQQPAASASGSPVTHGDRDLDLFWEAWRLVEKHFYGDLPDSQHLAWGAIRGALETLDDQHTVFLEPQPRQREKDALSGRFGGIGALVSKTDDGRIVLEPKPDLPAERAGIRTGDTVLKVDDTDITSDMTVDQVVDLVRGEVGTSVRLTLRHEGESEPFTVSIVREEIPNPTVEYRLLDGLTGAGYIRISLFSDRTDSELEAALDELERAGMTRLVLDLRGNGGGLLNAGIDVASEFLRDGTVLVQVEKGGKENVSEADGKGHFLDGTLLVLVDGGTASASEIVAGALQDRGRAMLIGEKTYGKGSVQQVFDLSDGSSVHITYADWLTPNRTKITGVGLTPDIEVAITDDDRSQGRDPQLDRAIEQLKTD